MGAHLSVLLNCLFKRNIKVLPQAGPQEETACSSHVDCANITDVEIQFLGPIKEPLRLKDEDQSSASSRVTNRAAVEQENDNGFENQLYKPQSESLPESIVHKYIELLQVEAIRTLEAPLSKCLHKLAGALMIDKALVAEMTFSQFAAWLYSAPQSHPSRAFVEHLYNETLTEAFTRSQLNDILTSDVRKELLDYPRILFQWAEHIAHVPARNEAAHPFKLGGPLDVKAARDVLLYHIGNASTLFKASDQVICANIKCAEAEKSTPAAVQQQKKARKRSRPKRKCSGAARSPSKKTSENAQAEEPLPTRSTISASPALHEEQKKKKRCRPARATPKVATRSTISASPALHEEQKKKKDAARLEQHQRHQPSPA